MSRIVTYRFIVLVLIVSFLSVMVPVQAEETDSIQVVLNQQEMQFDVSPRIINGRTMVPLRGIFEALEAEVDWNPDTRTVSAVKGDREVVLTIGQQNAVVNGDPVVLDAAPQVVDGRTLVPLRFVAETLGLKVEWDAATRTVYLRSLAKFVVTGDDGISEETITHVKSMLENEIVPYIEQLLPVTFSKTYTIKLYASRDNYAENFGYMGDYYADNTLAATRMTTILVANYAINTDHMLREVMAHEMVHVAISHLGIRGNIPLWYEEGLAERIRHDLNVDSRDVPGNARFDVISVIHAAANGELAPLDFSLIDHQEGLIQYRSYDHYEWAIRELEKVYGFDQIVSYLVQLKQDVDYKTAFTRVFKMDPAQFQRFVEERLAREEEEPTAPFTIKFSVDPDFSGKVQLTDFELEGEDPQHTSFGRLEAGTYQLDVDPENRKAVLIKNDRVLKNIKLQGKTGELYLSFHPDNIKILDGKVIEHVVSLIKYGFGHVYYAGIQVQMEHDHSKTYVQKTEWPDFYHIRDISDTKYSN
ncbi:MAG: copper amine oxidase N-terminal domain-containing protein [Bacillaceae bacterium]|nr:copper amine oxidase N-terminal domain-containing protein [Bacillaceae bacterium]